MVRRALGMDCSLGRGWSAGGRGRRPDAESRHPIALVDEKGGRGSQRGYLMLPIARPPCQYRCRNRNDRISGSTEMNEPVVIRFQTCSPPAPAFESAVQRL